MRRIALISDIHGNIAALDAVLADIDGRDVREIHCLGDLVGYGPEPALVLDRVRSAGIPTVIGNYDQGIGGRSGGCGCYYATDQAERDGAASYAFTEAAIDDERAAWLAGLPFSLRITHGDLRILLVHGSPRKVNEYLLPDRTEEQLARLALAAEADVVCVGHVHIPYDRAVRGPDGERLRYLSVGSVGKPKDGDPRACWAEVHLHDDGEVTVEFHRVPYGIEAVAARMRAVGLPATLSDALRRA